MTSLVASKTTIRTSVIPIKSILYCIIFIICNNARATYQQQQQLCPKSCTCDEQNLQVKCTAPVDVSGLPHTLPPGTKRIIMNNGQTTQYSLSLYPDLELLDLAFNRINIIDLDHLESNQNLAVLNFSHNNVVELKDSAISTILLNKLTTTFASPNIANSYDNNELDALKALKRSKINIVDLDVSYNNIKNLKNFTFIRSPKLQRLNLSYNYIVTIETDSLLGLNKLEYINLRGNHLIRIPSTALHNTLRSLSYSSPEIELGRSSLKHIDLSENIFISIEQTSFNQLDKVQEIHLDSCSIRTIENNAFEGLNTLYLLSLDNNHLTTVPSEALNQLTSLKLLRLSGNLIKQLHPDSFDNLSRLEELKLNNGSLIEIYDGAFRSLRSLKRLDLAYNGNLTRIEKGTFDHLPNLYYLSLYANSLTSLSDSFSDSSSLAILDLRGNPLSCNCDLKWLTKWLRKFNEKIDSMSKFNGPLNVQANGQADVSALLTDLLLTAELVNLTCTEPPALNGKSVIDLPDNRLECLHPNSDLNVHIGFASLMLMIVILTTVCVINFCRNERHLFGILKENLAQNRISTMIMAPYSQDRGNVEDLKANPGTQIECAEYEPVDYGQTNGPVYTVPGDQFMYYDSISHQAQQHSHQL